MKQLSKNILIIFIAIVAVVQSLFIYEDNMTDKSKACINRSDAKDYRTLSQFYNELNCLEEKNIIAANEKDGKWYIKLEIKGNRQDIINELSKLKVYDISDYLINHNNEEDSVTLEITDNTRT